MSAVIFYQKFNADLRLFCLNDASIKMQKYLVRLALLKCSFHQIKYKVKEKNKTLSCFEENNAKYSIKS